MTTVRFAVSPGTMFEIVIREPAALLSFDIVSVADTNWLPGFVVVAVKLALEDDEVTVRPISTSAESAMPARRVGDLRICCSFHLRLAGSLLFAGGVRGELSLLGQARPSSSRGRAGTPLVGDFVGRTGVLARPGDARGRIARS